MNFSAAEMRKLTIPLIVLAAFLAAGAGLIFWTQQEQHLAGEQLAAARAERTQARERLMRIAEEEKEVNDKLAVYRRLQNLHILGEEQRLEWADSMTRIRTQRELLDLRYIVERQHVLASIPGKPANVDFLASTMKVNIALLHEGDLLAFLRDLRESGSIEQDADVVMLLHREDYYRMSEPDFNPDNIAEVIIAKQRNGPTGNLNFVFLGRHTRFEEAAPDAWNSGGLQE